MLVFLAIVAACGNDSSESPDLAGEKAIPAEVQEQLQKANEVSTFQAGEATVPLFAVEVEVTKAGIRPLPETATIVYGPREENSAEGDLMVLASTTSPAKIQYAIEDPRFAEIEGEEMRELPSGRTFIHLPLRADYLELSIAPRERLVVHGFEREAGKRETTKTSVGGKFDLRPLVERACGSALELQACRVIMSRR
jgi:hypothetical protein